MADPQDQDRQMTRAEYLDKLWPGDSARQYIDAAFNEAIRQMVLAKLEREIANAPDPATIRALAKDVEAVRDPRWSP